MTSSTEVPARAIAERESRSPQQVMEHHIAALRSGDADALLADYAQDAVAIMSAGAFVGQQDLQRMVQFLVDKRCIMSTIEVSHAMIAADVVQQHFVLNGGTPRELTGSEIFVIRRGCIVFQALQPPVREVT
jgi:ketosteroid isomerase-like protein